jgi:hypothetical protein
MNQALIIPRRKGRTRHKGAREPNGQPQRTWGDIIPPEVLEQREKLVPKSRAKDAEAGTALGILYCRSDITWAMWQAGERLRQSWIRFRGMAGTPPRTITSKAGGRLLSANDPEWPDLDRAKHDYEEKFAVAVSGSKKTVMVIAMLDMICFEDKVPPRVYETGGVPDMLRQTIRDALGALAKFLRIEERE